VTLAVANADKVKVKARRSVDHLNVVNYLSTVDHVSLTSVNNATVAGKCNARAKVYTWYGGRKVTVMWKLLV
jgi:hypothetical protein